MNIKMFEVYESVLLFMSSIFFCYGLRIKKQHESTAVTEKRIPNPEGDYRKEKELFDKLFVVEGMNMNIHPGLYRSDDSSNREEEDLTHAENIWKSRILFQNTLQGNVLMYYDMYKMAFVYYSDMQIAYKWLNYCAMKYVRIFYCRDFFLDESLLPANFENPFNQKKNNEEKEELRKKEDKKKKMEIDFQSDVFLKRRETPKKIKETNTVVKEKKQKTDLTEKWVNNFRYMGKLANYSFLRIPAKVEKIIKDYQYIDFKKKFKEKQLYMEKSQNI